MNSDEVKQEILERLSDIESEEGVTIFFACESGSRAWGFPSADSDYDVRFLYLRPSEWYLSIDLEEKRDVIERPISDMLDISGWDLRKALQLFRKSNPPLLEWLNSPIVYQEKFSVSQGLRNLIPEYYSRVKCMHHYLHMAQGNFREYLRGDIVWVKKYFYVLRPILAIRWIETQTEIVPMEFAKLVERCVESHDLRDSINSLLERKMAGQELDRQPRINEISEYIESELHRIESVVMADNVKPDADKLNQLFRSSLRLP